jgi:hypothetical protein
MSTRFIECFLDLATSEASAPLASYLRLCATQSHAFAALGLATWATPLLSRRPASAGTPGAGRIRLPMVGAMRSPGRELAPRSTGAHGDAPDGARAQPARSPELPLEVDEELAEVLRGESPVEDRASDDLERLLANSPALAALGEDVAETLAEWHVWLYEVGRDALGIRDQVAEELYARPRLPGSSALDGFEALLTQAEGDLQILLAVGWPTVSRALRAQLADAAPSGAFAGL